MILPPPLLAILPASDFLGKLAVLSRSIVKLFGSLFSLIFHSQAFLHASVIALKHRSDIVTSLESVVVSDAGETKHDKKTMPDLEELTAQ